MIDLITNNPLDVIEILLILIVGLLIYKYLPSYFTEKGKNLATKEDIGDITRKVEEVKTEFIKVSSEHQIRFSKLHEKRAEIIAELYRRLNNFHWAVCAFLRDFHTTKNDKKEFKKLDDKSYEFTDYFHNHRIYFNENICSKINELVDALYSAYVPLESRDSNDKYLKEDWNNCAEIVQKQYPKIKESLESDFRKILGVSE